VYETEYAHILRLGRDFNAEDIGVQTLQSDFTAPINSPLNGMGLFASYSTRSYPDQYNLKIGGKRSSINMNDNSGSLNSWMDFIIDGRGFFRMMKTQGGVNTTTIFGGGNFVVTRESTSSRVLDVSDAKTRFSHKVELVSYNDEPQLLLIKGIAEIDSSIINGSIYLKNDNTLRFKQNNKIYPLTGLRKNNYCFEYDGVLPLDKYGFGRNSKICDYDNGSGFIASHDLVITNMAIHIETKFFNTETLTVCLSALVTNGNFSSRWINQQIIIPSGTSWTKNYIDTVTLEDSTAPHKGRLITKGTQVFCVINGDRSLISKIQVDFDTEEVEQ